MIISLTLLVPALALLGVVLWNVAAWPRVCPSSSGQPTEPQRAVSILIPARDEELNLAACLDHALAQGEIIGEVLVYDDHSVDRTPEIVRGYARRDARVRLIAPRALPAGWCGKNFACAELAAHARGEWLLFLDADARLETDGAARRMLDEARARRLTLLSCWPALDMKSFWEQLLMPLLNFVVFTLYPAPLAERRTDVSLALAHGACLLVERAAYECVGGHGAVRGEIFEDMRLAQAWRASGERGLCLDGRGIVSVRMYRTLAEIWSGFQKNFRPAFRGAASFWAFMALHAAVFWLPFVLWPFVNHRESLVLIAVAACVLSMRLALALRFGHALWSVLLHPFGETLLLALGVSSWRRCQSGRGVEWKGRRYHTHAETTQASVTGDAAQRPAKPRKFTAE